MAMEGHGSSLPCKISISSTLVLILFIALAAKLTKVAPPSFFVQAPPLPMKPRRSRKQLIVT